MPRAPPVTSATLPLRGCSDTDLCSARLRLAARPGGLPVLRSPPARCALWRACLCSARLRLAARVGGLASSPAGQSESLARDHAAHDLGGAAADRLPHALAPELLDA